jgi:Cof subfamily protein (haloacid dehalogenase superfamily)
VGEEADGTVSGKGAEDPGAARGPEVDGQRRAGKDLHAAPPRVIAIDIDGTLAAPGNVLSPAAGPAVGRAVAAGATVVLASGRMFVSVAGWADRLGLRGPLIAYNGAMVRTHPDGQTWWHQPVPLAAARRAVSACKDAGWYVQVYLDDELLVPWRDERTDWYSQNSGVPFTVDPDRVYGLPEAPTKLLVIEPAERMPSVRAGLTEAAKPDVLVMATSFPHYLEVTAAGINKGVALGALAKRMGVPADATMGIGDGDNDLPLLEAAGLRVAVQNAAPELRAAADIVTAAKYGDGVAEAIDRFYRA